MLSLLRLLLLSLGLVALVPPAIGQDNTVRLLVPFPAGTVVDSVARMLAAHMSTTLKKTVVVLNRPGAGGEIAARETARAAPDGTTLLLATGQPMTAIPALKKEPTYGKDDFTPIGLIARYSHFVLVPKDLPVNTWAEFLDYAKARPNGLNAASLGVFYEVIYNRMFKPRQIPFTMVNYQGEPAALNDLMAGRVDLFVTTQGLAVPLMKADKVKALVASSPVGRHPDFPSVPTVGELGLHPFPGTWVAMFGPAGIAESTRSSLNQALQAALAQEEVGSLLLRQGVLPSRSTPAELGEIVDVQIKEWRQTIDEMGIPRQ